MKHQQLFMIISCFITVLACAFNGLVVAQTNLKTSTGVHDAQTNGITAEIRVAWIDNKQLIIVGITIPSEDIIFTNVCKNPGWSQYKYFEATNFKTSNSFFGPIELQDAAGHKAPLLEPDINLLDGYPLTNSVKMANHILMSKYRYYPYNGPPLPLAFTERSTIIPFCLEDMFKLEKPDKYKLTVYPKVYKRISPTNDICQRIDLPPVTIPIKWKGKP